jgi:hypothetical protein
MIDGEIVCSVTPSCNVTNDPGSLASDNPLA